MLAARIVLALLLAHVALAATPCEDVVCVDMEVLGLSGNSGYSGGPHLHFQVWRRSRGRVATDTPDLVSRGRKSGNRAGGRKAISRRLKTRADMIRALAAHRFLLRPSR